MITSQMRTQMKRSALRTFTPFHLFSYHTLLSFPTLSLVWVFSPPVPPKLQWPRLHHFFLRLHSAFLTTSTYISWIRKVMPEKKQKLPKLRAHYIKNLPLLLTPCLSGISRRPCLMFLSLGICTHIFVTLKHHWLPLKGRQK